MNGYVKAEEMAERWNVSVRQIQLLCQSGKIEDDSKLVMHGRYPKTRRNQQGLELISLAVNRKYNYCMCL
jgi:hypothetical protein